MIYSMAVHFRDQKDPYVVDSPAAFAITRQNGTWRIRTDGFDWYVPCDIVRFIKLSEVQ